MDARINGYAVQAALETHEIEKSALVLRWGIPFRPLLLPVKFSIYSLCSGHFPITKADAIAPTGDIPPTTIAFFYLSGFHVNLNGYAFLVLQEPARLSRLMRSYKLRKLINFYQLKKPKDINSSSGSAC
ncbi:hypothetical protein O9H85_05635 [Paenibacillus filicis]|uniref:Uncharacterized protein n=1 Tax=Paenibacillus gyeongsangnamensis TaxID=3388067 RepID=A0ABT4Q545_9BACL|nr:hypothetical protein [Paenibacillus filicis]MCZ8511912.1 hypothetical protein [Paenibacillus filicis]